MCQLLQKYLFGNENTVKAVLRWLLHDDITKLYEGITKIRFSSDVVNYLRQQAVLFQDTCKKRKLDSVINFNLDDALQTAENCIYCKDRENCVLSNTVEIPQFTHAVSNYKLFIRLVNLYSAIIEANLLKNLFSEISFLLSLLLINHNIDLSQTVDNNTLGFLCNINESYSDLELYSFENWRLFKTGIDCIFLTCLVLIDHSDLILCLDHSALKSLAHNCNLSIFATSLCIKIHLFMHEKKIRKLEYVHAETKPDTVKFQCASDTKLNYATNQSFLEFKNHRDDFYALLHDWKQFRSTSQKFFTNNHRRVRSIIIAVYKSDNMFRFTDLFVSQMVASDRHDVQNNIDDKNINKNNAQMNRLDLLAKRLVTPNTNVTSKSCIPVFIGTQEFFKDFIRCAAENSFFLTFLRDIIIHRIAIYNSKKWEANVSGDDEKGQMYLTLKKKLCLMAKFLSLITFMPYKMDYLPPLQTRLNQIEARSEVLPPLYLEKYIYESAKSGRMVITIPWVIEFLIGIDKISIWLPCYKRIFKLLELLLYRIQLPRCKDVQFCLWCKETSSISELYSRVFVSLYIHSVLRDKLLDSVTHSVSQDISNDLPNEIIVDADYLINDSVLHKCFPQFAQLHFPKYTEDLYSKRMVIPTMTEPSERSMEKSFLQVQMESQFLAGLPYFVRNTIEFVSKRVCSMCIKSISESTVPNFRTRLRSRFTSIAISIDQKRNMFKENSSFREELIKKVFDSDDNTLGTLHNLLKLQIDEKLVKFCDNIATSIQKLVETEEQSELPVPVCTAICIRKFKAMVQEWLQSHINFDELINTEVECALHEKWSIKQLVDESELCSVTTTKKLASDWKNINVCIKSDTVYKNISYLDLKKIIRFTSYCINSESSISEDDTIQIIQTSVDTLIALVYFKPVLVTEKLVKKCCRLWQSKYTNLMRPCIGNPFSSQYIKYFLRSSFSDKQRTTIAMSIYLQAVLHTNIYNFTETNKAISNLLQQVHPKRAVVYFLSVCFMLISKSSSDEAFKLEIATLLNELLIHIYYNY